ncbi:MAG: IS30 family transposase [Nitrospirota bacterium]
MPSAPLRWPLIPYQATGKATASRGPARARPSRPWWRGPPVWSSVRITGTDARSACKGFTKTLRHVPTLLRQTLTYDRGNEMAEHQRLAERLAIWVFFAAPYSPWQRSTYENTNGLLRQYLPKGTDLSGYTQREWNAIAYRVNMRPRKCLDVATPPGSLCASAPSCTCCTWNLKPPL